ncbi:hemolysin [Photobacterium phosphoreum]|uniref:Hemolysin n=1 Tax=Photobacterium phosphoreum TaxID=659 RepID=A0A2T3JQ11_PHOPO|nr:leukocidin family pore-forming toxin [Photobacterium phosphoreum]PSU24698.1 hemolysin [Photobacterium phosphoreum]PSU38258.1 hemolysin [Photobacterium phosphoreum]PSU51128.1 hemolysin [Photobacterium phosphoreum]
MLISGRWALFIIYQVVVLFSPVINANDDLPQGLAVQILSQIKDSRKVNYVNAENWLIEKNQDINKNPPSSLKQIKTKVLKYNQPTLVDFSRIIDESQKEKAKELFRTQIGVSFPSDYLIVTKHKGELMFSLIEDDDDPAISLLEADNVDEVDFTARIEEMKSITEHDSLPHLSFYLDVNRKISIEECLFKWSTLWSEFGERYFCENANISLIYRVNLQRSFAYGTEGAETPDAKIVRISLDDESSGSGIHLNESLLSTSIFVPYLVFVGYGTEWATDAIAQDYFFSFNASNSKAEILRTVPRSNLNANYENKEISGFTVGVTAAVEASEAGPKATLSANASYTQTRWLTFKTKDYRVERSTTDGQNVSFKWNRDHYATAESLLNRSSDALWVHTYPADIKRINPISYKSFIPKMDVIFKAEPDTVGTTVFDIDSSVNIRPIYHGTYRYYYVLGAHQTYYGLENTPRKRVNKNVNFTVDWTHPVFSGSRFVDLQLGSFNDQCLELSSVGRILTRGKCTEGNISQSFIYDKHNRYVSAFNTSLCLDGELLSRLRTCDMSLSQRWQWVKDTDKLRNFYDDRFLGHNKSTGELGLYTEGSDQISLRTMTDYTNFLKKAPL